MTPDVARCPNVPGSAGCTYVNEGTISGCNPNGALALIVSEVGLGVYSYMLLTVDCSVGSHFILATGTADDCSGCTLTYDATDVDHCPNGFTASVS